MEHLLVDIVGWLSTLAEAISTLFIGIGIVQGLILSAALALPKQWASIRTLDPRESIRLKLGRWLALALEFQLAADILKTAVAPTWDDIGKVAAIIVLRTMLNFFLEREIANFERQLREHQPADKAPA
ncbi:MAG TPA: DUF1622 domain-containing protein [Stellaceae bacterium]|nr:DUF1622 domain-containing protein [Stellaceae bacterium]